MLRRERKVLPNGRLMLDTVSWLRLALWLVVGAIVIVPLTAVAVLGLSGNHIQVLLDGNVLEAGRNSLVSAGVSAVLAVVIGTGLALLLDHTDLPGRFALRLFLLSPLLVPPFVGAIAWLGIFGPSSSLNLAWAAAFGGPLWNLYGGDGVIFLLTVHSYPVAYLIVGAALRRIPSDLEQAARIGGATTWQAMRDVTLPLLRPALLSAFTLTTVSNLADFGIPSIVGLPERFVTLSTLVYRYIQSGTVDKPLEVVGTIGIVLLVIAIIALAINARLALRDNELEAAAGPRVPFGLGRARWTVGFTVWVLGLSVTLLPLLALASQSLLPAPGVPFTWENLTLTSIERALTAPSTLIGAVNSITLALGAGLICAILGLALATVATRTKARGNRALGALAMLPQAIPGLVLAVGWLILAPHIGLFNTRSLILCAYVMSFLALVVQAVDAPLRSTPAAFEEAARISGASRFRSLFDISWRMSVPAAVTGGVLVVLTAARELTISVLLLAPGNHTLGVSIFNLQQAGAYNAASALALVVTIAGLAGLALLGRRSQS